MARRKNEPIPDDEIDFNDPFAGLASSLEDEIEPPAVSDRGERRKAEKSRAPKKPKTRRKSGGPLGCIGGLIAALILGVLIVPLFLVAGFGIAFGLDQAGVELPVVNVQNLLAGSPEATDTPEGADNAAASAGSDPSSSAGTGTEGSQGGQPIAAVPTLSNTCSEGATWWTAQQTAWNEFVGVGAEVIYVPTGDPLTPRLAQLRIRRTDAQNVLTPPCLEPARDQMLAAMDTVISALQLVESGDRIGALLALNSGLNEMAETLTLLWDINVWTSPDAPPPSNIPRGGGEGCEASQWIDGLSLNWRNVIATADQTNFSSASPLELRGTVNTMTELQTQFSGIGASGCETPLQRYLLSGVNNVLAAVNAGLQGTAAPARDALRNYLIDSTLLDAWLIWYGIAAF